MSVIQINIVVLVTLFCVVHLVSCEKSSWGEWKTFKGCQQKGSGWFGGRRLEKREQFRIVNCDNRSENQSKNTSGNSKYNVTEQSGNSKYNVTEQSDNSKYNVTEQSDNSIYNVTEQSDNSKYNVTEQSDNSKYNVTEQSDNSKYNVTEQSDYSKYNVTEQSDNSKNINVTEQFQYPNGTRGSKHGTPLKYTVPTDGCYKISATGASGYRGPHYASGATATGVFKLNRGLELTIVVGKFGRGDIDIGGGGGTFVFTVTKDNERGDLYVVGGGAGYPGCNEVDINCEHNGQDSENGGGRFGGRNGRGGGCHPGYSCSGDGAGWLSAGCGDDKCVYNGESFEGAFVGGDDGGYGGGGYLAGGGYSGGYYKGGGGSFVNSIASHSNKHKNLPTSTRQHGTASVELVDDRQC